MAWLVGNAMRRDKQTHAASNICLCRLFLGSILPISTMVTSITGKIILAVASTERVIAVSTTPYLAAILLIPTCSVSFSSEKTLIPFYRSVLRIW